MPIDGDKRRLRAIRRLPPQLQTSRARANRAAIRTGHGSQDRPPATRPPPVRPLTGSRPARIRPGMNDDVRKLIERLAPNPVCDTCVADRLGLADHQEASIAANELAGSSQFERRPDTCALCAATKLTTRRVQ